MAAGRGGEGSAGVPLSLLGHRAHLDGLRSVAVYLVVAFHAGVGRLSGGFVGVDVFFVLSGYLVTQVLVRDGAADGSLDLLRFYSRRARRLLPAAAVVLVTTAIVFSWVGSPAEWSAAVGGIRAAALYFANWHFLSQSADYFAADIETSPVIHFWSLAVEEQFYVLWPLVLLGVHRLVRPLPRPRRAVQLVVAGGAFVSLAAALWTASSDINRAYFGTDTRAYQLLAGALLALAPGVAQRLGRKLTGQQATLAILTCLALLVVTSSWMVDLDAVSRGAVAALITVVLIAVLDGAPGGFGRRLLSLHPLTYLGRISYGTYLWHWPVVVVLTRQMDLSTPQVLAATTVIASGLAALSFELLEHPVRTAALLDRRPGPAVAGGLALSLLVGLVVVPAVLDARGGNESLVLEASSPDVEEGSTELIDWAEAQDDVAAMSRCDPDHLEGCHVVTGTGDQILLLGDSHARMFIPLFEELAHRLDLGMAAAVMPQCPWPQGLRYASSGQECAVAQRDWYGAVLESVDPDVVVLAHRAVDDLASPVMIVSDETEWLDPGTDEFEDLLRARMTDTVMGLRERGVKVVIVEPVPITAREDDPVECLSRESAVAPCRFVTDPSALASEVIARRLAAEDPGVWTLDLDRAACPYLPICDPVVGGIVVRRDNTHLTTRFVRSLVDGLEEHLVEREIVAG